MSIVSFESEDDLQGQEEVWDAAFGFGKSMALKAAINLGIADVIASKGNGSLLSLDEIAQGTDSKNKDTLFRILRFLVYYNIFREEKAVNPDNGKKETRYGLTRASKWIVRHENSVSPLVLMILDKALEGPWHHFHECAREEGGNVDAFKRANGKSIWEFARENPWFTKLFSDAMAAGSIIYASDILDYKHLYEGVGTLVDVGGGPGILVSRIVKAYPHIKGINFELPHVIAQAPAFPGVEHVAGDMFKSIPSADAILLKAVLHNWDDENCVKILKLCHKALPDNGKLIIIDPVVEEAPDLALFFDLMMLADTTTGRERTREEWEKLLASGGFPTVRVQKMKCNQCLIEAFKS